MTASDHKTPSDRELLELAAKAAGYEVRGLSSCGTFLLQHPAQELPRPYHPTPWNPLADDGDALRLAVKLELQLRLRHSENEVSAYGSPDGRIDEGVHGDPCAATRRAIVKAAAEIGRAAQ